MSVNALNKEDIVFLVRLCERSGRLGQMRAYMRQYITDQYHLSISERQLFSLAYRNVCSVQRRAWRSLRSIEHDYGEADSRLPAVVALKSKVEEEIRSTSLEALDLLAHYLLPTCGEPEGKVYYLKLQADYERDVAEISTGSEHSKWTAKAHESYKASADVALCRLPPIHATRLGLMLNFSVFYYEVYGSAERACLLAKSAYDDAIEGGLLAKKRVAAHEEEFIDSLEVMRNIKANLLRWTKPLTGSVAADADQDTTQGEWKEETKWKEAVKPGRK